MNSFIALSTLLTLSTPNAPNESTPDKAPRQDAAKHAKDMAVVRHAGILGMMRSQEGSAIRQVLYQTDLGNGMDDVLSRLKARYTASSGQGLVSRFLINTQDRSLSIGSLQTRSDGEPISGRPKRNIQPAKVNHQPGLTRSEVKEVMNQATHALELCTREQKKRHPRYRDILDTQVVIAASGAVSEAQVVSVDGSAPEMMACVKSALTALQFPAPRGGGTAVVRNVFLLGAN